MKKLLPILLLLIVGCSTSRITKIDSKTGDKFTASNTRWFWTSEGVEIGFSKDANGTTSATAKIQKSNASAEALKAVADGVATGLGKTLIK